MDDELCDVEVIRLQINDPLFETSIAEDIKHLCKAFGFGLKIINQTIDGISVGCVFDIHYSACSFYHSDYQSIIKTFIIHKEVLLVNVGTVRRTLDELVALSESESYEVENLHRLPNRLSD